MNISYYIVLYFNEYILYYYYCFIMMMTMIIIIIIIILLSSWYHIAEHCTNLKTTCKKKPESASPKTCCPLHRLHRNFQSAITRSVLVNSPVSEVHLYLRVLLPSPSSITGVLHNHLRKLRLEHAHVNGFPRSFNLRNKVIIRIKILKYLQSANLYYTPELGALYRKTRK